MVEPEVDALDDVGAHRRHAVLVDAVTRAFFSSTIRNVSCVDPDLRSVNVTTSTGLLCFASCISTGEARSIRLTMTTSFNLNFAAALPVVTSRGD